MNRIWIFIFCVMMLVLVSCGEPKYKGTLLPEPITAPEITLTNADGELVNLSDYRDKIVLLYFGYTFCPDVCPASMSVLGQVQREMDDKAEDIQVIMVTVDPERDTPEALGKYVTHFHPSFVGLSGSLGEIDQVVEDFGVYYERHEGTAATGYLVDHTARVFVIDKDGMYWLSFPFETTAEDIITDLKLVLKQG